jgi:hypothetical protein
MTLTVYYSLGRRKYLNWTVAPCTAYLGTKRKFAITQASSKLHRQQSMPFTLVSERKINMPIFMKIAKKKKEYDIVSVDNSNV